ncbi:MAG: S8 family serine peptidase, partial [Candidatus Kariarchaeaceae archaeon]
MKTYTLGFIIGFILITSSSVSATTISNSAIPVVEYLTIDRPVFMSTETTDPIFQDFILYADNNEEYELFRHDTNVITEYPNIQALRVRDTIAKFKQLQAFYPENVYPTASNYETFKAHSGSNAEKLSAITSDGVPEANIMNVQELWSQGYKGSGVVIAIWDDGINYQHPGLVNSQYSGIATIDVSDIPEIDFYGTPCGDHGTPVAGAAAASGTDTGGHPGNAPESKLLAIAMACPNEEGVTTVDSLLVLDTLATHSNQIDIV